LTTLPKTPRNSELVKQLMAQWQRGWQGAKPPVAGGSKTSLCCGFHTHTPENERSNSVKTDFHRTALLVASVFALGGSTLQAATAAARKPNLIFILADDLGIGNVSCYGADHFKTPNIDALAKGGIRYTHAFTAPLCGPSRALILTGRYAFRTGAVNQDQTGLMKPGEETFMPKVLKPAGYVTAAIGKWGQLPLGSAEFGFDDYLRFRGSGAYWGTKDQGTPYVLNGKHKILGEKEYLPDLMHQRLIEFLTKHGNDPFYIYYSLSHVHAPILPTPDSAPDSEDLFGDNVAYMDKLVGKLVAELERLKLRENTLIIFFGDNGTGKAWADRSTIGGRRLSGEKGSMLEGGGLVPLIANWPGTTPAGKVSPDLVDASDFFPTFAELAGVKLPDKAILDGRSLAAQLRGQKGQPRQSKPVRRQGTPDRDGKLAAGRVPPGRRQPDGAPFPLSHASLERGGEPASADAGGRD
jgi:arylsulfatase A